MGRALPPDSVRACTRYAGQDPMSGQLLLGGCDGRCLDVGDWPVARTQGVARATTDVEPIGMDRWRECGFRPARVHRGGSGVGSQKTTRPAGAGARGWHRDLAVVRISIVRAGGGVDGNAGHAFAVVVRALTR